MNVEDILKLMGGMSNHRIGMLEVEGLKLVAAPPDRSAAAASAFSVPSGSRGAVPQELPPPPADAEAAARAVEAARVASREIALQGMRDRTAAARRKAAGGIGQPSIGKMVDDLVKEANKPRRARRPNA